MKQGFRYPRSVVEGSTVLEGGGSEGTELDQVIYASCRRSLLQENAGYALDISFFLIEPQSLIEVCSAFLLVSLPTLEVSEVLQQGSGLCLKIDIRRGRSAAGLLIWVSRAGG